MEKKRGPVAVWWCKAYGEGLRKRAVILRDLCKDGRAEDWPECEGCAGPTKYVRAK